MTVKFDAMNADNKKGRGSIEEEGINDVLECCWSGDYDVMCLARDWAA